MATLTPTLSLVSTDASSDNLNFSVDSTLTTTHTSQGPGKISCATSSGTALLTTGQTSIAYVYFKNTGKLAADGADTTNIITLQDAAGNTFSDVGAGEFAFFPLKGAQGLTAVSDTAAVVGEFAFYTKA